MHSNTQKQPMHEARVVKKCNTNANARTTTTTNDYKLQSFGSFDPILLTSLRFQQLIDVLNDTLRRRGRCVAVHRLSVLVYQELGEIPFN